MKFLNDKWLSMNKKVAYRKTLISLNKEDISYLVRYLHKIMYK